MGQFYLAGVGQIWLALKVEAVTGKKIKVLSASRRKGDPPALVADSAKAVKILGWKPLCSDLNAIVKTAWNWHTKANF